MDIQKIITDLVGQLNADKNLTASFKKDPAATVKSLVKGLGVTDEQLNAIIKGISAKMGIDDVKGVLNMVNGLFGK